MRQEEKRTARERKTEQQRRKEIKQRRKRKARRRLLKRVCFLILGCFLFVLLAKNVGQFVGWVQDRADRKEMAEKTEQLEEKGYPESLLELLEKNPEARQFVLNYEKNKDKEWDRDVSDELEDGEIPLFLQWDERWGYEMYGGDFIAVTGCGPTCLSMVVCGLTGEAKWNPYEVAKWAEEQGFYVEGSGSAWDLMMSGAEELGLISEEVVFDELNILAALESGKPIICAVRAGDFTTSGHFLVLTGVDENGDILLQDPNSPKRSAQSWELEELMPQIKNLWAYKI